MQRKALLAVLVIAIILVGVVLAVWWYSQPTEKVTIAMLVESAPEPLTISDTELLDLYKESHPNIEFAVDIVPRETFSTLALREIIEGVGKYDIMTSSEQEIFKGRELDSLYSLEGPEINAIDPTFKTQLRSDVITFCTNPDTGKMDVAPVTHWNSQCLFYRKDLLEDPAEKEAFLAQYGYELKPPETWTQMRDVAEFFNRPPDLYGVWTTGGVGWALVYGEFWTWMQSMNGDIIINNEVAIDSTAWREALEFQKSLTEFSPPGWEGSDWFEGLTLFEQGKIALHEQFYFPWAEFFNAESVAPEVLGNVGVTAPPKSPIDISRGALTLTPAEVIPKSSPHPQEAAEFLRWLQSYDIQKKLALTGTLMMPARNDIATDSEVDAKIHSSAIQNMPGIADYKLVALGDPTFYSKVDLCTPIFAEGYIKYMTDQWSLEETISFMQTEVEKVFA